MKLVLHIGTHKTASTSMQHFCALNRSLLLRKGYHYPRNRHSAYVANFLGSWLSNQQNDKVARFFDKAYKKAIKMHCHTVIVSAESLYAITGFFRILSDRHLPGGDYWQTEKQCIQALKKACEQYDDIEILCYLRPQDEFGSSLYNQAVKSVFGTPESYDEYIPRIMPIFDYKRHLDLWAAAFEKNALTLKNFNSCKADPVLDFCKTVLDESIYRNAQKKHLHANERLSRDLLEFKRLTNITKPDKALAFVNIRCFQKLSQEYPDQPGYQIFSSYKNRRNYFQPYERGNQDLEKDYKIDPLPVIHNKDDPTYKALSEATRVSIEKRYRQLLNEPRNFFERQARTTIHFLISKLPGLDKMLEPVRTARNWIRLHIEGW